MRSAIHTTLYILLLASIVGCSHYPKRQGRIEHDEQRKPQNLATNEERLKKLILSASKAIADYDSLTARELLDEARAIDPDNPNIRYYDVLLDEREFTERALEASRTRSDLWYPVYPKRRAE